MTWDGAEGDHSSKLICLSCYGMLSLDPKVQLLSYREWNACLCSHIFSWRIKFSTPVWKLTNEDIPPSSKHFLFWIWYLLTTVLKWRGLDMYWVKPYLQLSAADYLSPYFIIMLRVNLHWILSSADVFKISFQILWLLYF